MYSIGETSRVQLGYEVTNEFSKKASIIKGNEKVANSVLESIIDHFSEYEPRKLNLQAKKIEEIPRSSDKYKKLIKFIENQANQKHPFVLVVDDKKNTRKNLIRITTTGNVEYSLDTFKTLRVRNILEEEEINLIESSRMPLLQHKSILIAESAMQAIRNTRIKIKKEETKKQLTSKKDVIHVIDPRESRSGLLPESISYKPTARRSGIKFCMIL